MSSTLTEGQLKQAIQAIFIQYDQDQSGTLEGTEISKLINDVFIRMGKAREIQQQDIDQFLNGIDKNGDGKVSKTELLDIFKKFMGKK